MDISRRAALGGMAPFVAGLAAPAVIIRPGWAKTTPIKIGIVEPLSGALRGYGQADVHALTFAAKQLNDGGGILGREVLPVVGEAEMKLEVGTRRVNDLLMEENVDFLTCFSSALSKVAAQLCNRRNKLFVTSQSAAPEMLAEEFVPTSFFTAMTSPMQARAMAAFLAQSAFTKIYSVHPDDAVGQGAGIMFKEQFDKLKRGDQTLVGEDYIPLASITDFAPFITKISSTGADLLFTSTYGQDLRLMISQGRSLGWSLKVAGFYLHDPSLCKALGDDIIGHYTLNNYLLTIDNDLNRKMIAGWQAAYPDAELDWKLPDLVAGRAVYLWYWLANVIQRAGSTNPEAMIAAWENATFDTAWGPVQMRACDHQSLSSAYAAQFVAPSDIPKEIRYHGDEFPYIGRPVKIAREKVTVPPELTHNGRCKA